MNTPLHKLPRILVLILLLLLSACAKAPALDGSSSSPFPAPSPPPAAETAAPRPQDGDNTPAPGSAGISLSLDERMAAISFTPVSGQYVRRSMQGDIAYTEMFAPDKSSFVRAALDGTEEEVFAYNYQLDRFTYMYFFEGEMLSKTVYDMGTGTVLADEDDLAELLTGSAQDLKDYFHSLLTQAGIGVAELG